MLKSSLCDYSDAYILFQKTISVASQAGAGAASNKGNKNVMIKKYPSFTGFISEINNTQYTSR